MSKFDCRVKCKDGSEKKVMVEAVDPQAVVVGLEKRGYSIISISAHETSDIIIQEHCDTQGSGRGETPRRICCPSCRGEAVQRKEMIYNGGTTDISMISKMSGVSHASGDPLGMYGSISHSSTTSTTGLQQSRVAQMASPPSMIKMPVYYWGLLITPLLPLLIIMMFYYHFKYRDYNELEFPKLLLRWKKQWMCLTCGHEFIPQN